MLEDRILIIELYYQNRLSAATTIRKFQTMKKLHKKPFHKSTVIRLVAKFRATGSVHDAAKQGRPCLDDGSTDQVEDVITNLQDQSQLGSCSTRVVANICGLSQSSVCKIMKYRLKLYPYKIKFHHELSYNKSSTSFLSSGINSLRLLLENEQLIATN